MAEETFSLGFLRQYRLNEIIPRPIIKLNRLVMLKAVEGARAENKKLQQVEESTKWKCPLRENVKQAQESEISLRFIRPRTDGTLVTSLRN